MFSFLSALSEHFLSFFRVAKVLLNLKMLKNKVLIIPKIDISISIAIFYVVQKMCILCFFSLQNTPEGAQNPKNRPRRVNGGVHVFLSVSLLLYGKGTRLLNPMKAIARMPAVTRAMGTPFIPLGVPVSSSCSRMPAKMTSARVKPTAMLAE